MENRNESRQRYDDKYMDEMSENLLRKLGKVGKKFEIMRLKNKALDQKIFRIEQQRARLRARKELLLSRRNNKAIQSE